VKSELRVLFPLIFVILLIFLVGCAGPAMDRPPVVSETESDPGLADLPPTQTAAADTDSVRRGEAYRT